MNDKRVENIASMFDKKDIHLLSMPDNSLYFSIGYRLEDSDMKIIEPKEISQNIMSQFDKLKDKRKKQKISLLKQIIK